ncbi:MAG: baseplate J/gp47 family protein [Acidobacteriota bacterium]
MPIELPNLDDRTYQELVEEARTLIPQYAPGWTNHNPSDPGITLIELFAYLTELLIYRLNRVSDANIRSFLRLLDTPSLPLSSNLQAEISRTILRLREPQRAITIKDYQYLALRHFPNRVKRVCCLPNRNLELTSTKRYQDAPGHISVVILPAKETDKELTNDVSKFFDERRLLTTRLHIVKPRYVDIGVRIEIHLKHTASASDIREKVKKELYNYFNASTGGQEKTGWPFGRSVYISEVYSLIDNIAGIDFATKQELTTTSNTKRLKYSDQTQQELIGIELYQDELVNISVDDSDIAVIEPK